MRVSVLFLVLLLGGTAHAEKVRANQSTRVFNHPGEHGKVVAKVKEGQAMTVLAKEDRWIKVRVAGRTGYVPRSKVDMPDDEEIVRNTRRRPFVDGRGTKRGFGGEEGPDDRIGADATETGGDDDGEASSDTSEGSDDGDKPKKPKKPKHTDKDEGDEGDDGEASEASSGGDDEPSEDAEEEPGDDRLKASVPAKTVIYNEADKGSGESFKAKPGDVLYVGEKKGKWVFVETEDGDAGYVLSSKLDVDEGGGGGGALRGRVIDARARLGVTFVQQAVRTAGGTGKWPDAYNIGSSSFDVAIGGAVLYPYKKRFVLGGELAYDYAKAIPGIAFDPDTAAGPMPSSTTGFTLHNFNLRAVGGYDLRKKSGMMVFARLGYHYTSFKVDNYNDLTKNTARLANETLGAPTFGGALTMPMLTDKIGLRVSLDFFLFGASIKQTKNLEDGASPSGKGANLGAGFTYRWKKEMDIQATYDLNYTSLSFGTPVATSMRMHTGTSVSRTDVNHTIAVGIAKAF